jgi:hypothetical protein
MSRFLDCSLMVASSLVLASAAGFAQNSPCRDNDRIIEHSQTLRRQTRDAEALQELSALWQRCPSPRLQAQIALAEDALGHYMDSYTHLNNALGAVSDPWIESRRSALEEVRQHVRARLAALLLSADVTGAELYISGHRVGALPLAEPYVTAVGAVELEVRHNGNVTRFSRTLTEGATLRETLHVDTARANTTAVSNTTQAPVVAGAPNTPSRTGAVVGYVLIGLGAAALTGATITWALSASQTSSAVDDTPWRSFYYRELQPAAQSPEDACTRAETSTTANASYARDLCASNGLYRTLSYALGISGLALAGVGVVLVATAPSSRSRTQTSQLRVLPLWSPQAMGASVQVSF